MGQISSVLRSVRGGHAHWCPGCNEMHVVPDSWTFDGNAALPTFSPSVRIRGVRTHPDTGLALERDAEGRPVEFCCHYILTAGRLNFCGDSTHALAGQTVDLPELPAHLRDGDAP